MTLIEPKPSDATPKRSAGWHREVWKESHGTWILAFAALIVLAGVISIYFAPPAEPDTTIELTETGGPIASEPLPENSLLLRVSTEHTQSKSPIRMAIYDSSEAFGDPDKAILKDSIVPVDGFALWNIALDQLPESFAIAAFHDLDDNGILNRALLNMPVEPYGFSNNARNAIGPPSFDQTLITRPEESIVVEIRVFN